LNLRISDSEFRYSKYKDRMKSIREMMKERLLTHLAKARIVPLYKAEGIYTAMRIMGLLTTAVAVKSNPQQQRILALYILESKFDSSYTEDGGEVFH